MSPQLDAIWHQIERLNEAERLALEQRILAHTESQWRHETQSAREMARERGIDQKSIDDAVEQLRYGS